MSLINECLYIVAFPPLGVIIPVSMLIRVVFPAPLCPNSAIISFSLRLSEKSLTAWNLPNFFESFKIFTFGSEVKL
jgi:hypothetical protein